MFWHKDFENGLNSVWINTDGSERFIHLSQWKDGTQWMVKIGVKSNASHNQERLFKNRSRAMISVNNIMKSKNWRI